MTLVLTFGMYWINYVNNVNILLWIPSMEVKAKAAIEKIYASKITTYVVKIQWHSMMIQIKSVILSKINLNLFYFNFPMFVSHTISCPMFISLTITMPNIPQFTTIFGSHFNVDDHPISSSLWQQGPYHHIYNSIGIIVSIVTILGTSYS